MLDGPPSPPSKGVKINTLIGGMWLVTNFKAEMMGMPFEERRERVGLRRDRRLLPCGI